MNRDNELDRTGAETGGEMLSPSRPVRRQKQNKPLMRLVGLGVMLLGSVTVLLCLLLLIFPLFRVGSIEVVGNSHYSAEELVSLAELEEGMEVLSIDAKKTADLLLESSPYLQSCKISVFPFSVKIEVVEKSRVMYTEHDRKFVSFELLSDLSLKVLEVSDSPDGMKNYPMASLPAISHAKEGGRISFQQSALNLSYIANVISVLEEYEVFGSVESIDFSSRNNIFYELENGCRVKLGKADELEDKVVEALNQFQNNSNVIEIDVSDLQKPTIKTY